MERHNHLGRTSPSKDTSDNVISYDTLKEYMETNGYEDYESPIKILDDVELWKDPQVNRLWCTLSFSG